MPRSKPFVIATEGPTIDGRNISREWIEQMAKNYDPAVYTAVANLEHYLSMAPDSLFSAMGKVVALGTQETTILGEKKLQLTAVVDASEKAVSMQNEGKKLFASMEVLPNFIGKGLAYLTGLAFTDKPASIGTEPMKFSANAGADSRYAFAEEISIEWEDVKPDTSAGASLFAKVKELLGLQGKKDDDHFADIGQAVETIAASQRDALAAGDQFAAELKAATDQIAALTAAAEADRKAFADLKASLEGQEDGTQRPPATGGNGQQLAEF